jgi:Ca2+-binding EF-hand superfamily protein
MKPLFCFKNTNHLNSHRLERVLKFCIQFTPDVSLIAGIANRNSCFDTKLVQFTFLHIVMKVALFYPQNRSESSTFLHHFIPSPWRWLSKHTNFFV